MAVLAAPAAAAAAVAVLVAAAAAAVAVAAAAALAAVVVFEALADDAAALAAAVLVAVVSHMGMHCHADIPFEERMLVGTHNLVHSRSWVKLLVYSFHSRIAMLAAKAEVKDVIEAPNVTQVAAVKAVLLS